MQFKRWLEVSDEDAENLAVQALDQMQKSDPKVHTSIKKYFAQIGDEEALKIINNIKSQISTEPQADIPLVISIWKLFYNQLAQSSQLTTTVQPANKNPQLVATMKRGVLSQQEVKQLGLNPNDSRVWIGSTVDKQAEVYPYVYIRAKGLYFYSPNYKG